MQCPRKFYLKNICSLDGDDIGRTWRDGGRPPSSTSSLERGENIHRELSGIVKGGFVEPEDLAGRFDGESCASIRWALSRLHGIKEGYKVLSEISMKFDLFGHKVVGIPDLVCLSSSPEENIRIIDFKTGRIRKSDEPFYRFQLAAYAYAVSQEYNRKGKFSLELVYVDERKVLEFPMIDEEIEDYLRKQWDSTAALDRVDKNHCPDCEFEKLCRF